MDYAVSYGFLESLEDVSLDYTERAIVRRAWLLARMAEQQDRCKYCHYKIYIITPDMDRRASVDHVISRARQGPDAYANVVAACLPCNSRKGGELFENYLQTSPWFQRRLREGLEEMANDKLS